MYLINFEESIDNSFKASQQSTLHYKISLTNVYIFAIEKICPLQDHSEIKSFHCLGVLEIALPA